MGTIREHSNKILITGSNGLLGQKLVALCIENKIDFLATAKDDNRFSLCPNEKFKILDITESSQVDQVIKEYQPTHIINTAAMTNVDDCEENAERCYAINYDGVNNILQAIKGCSIHLIQISTDFIFDGEKEVYDETDLPNPLGTYGKSKWEAEQLLQKSNYRPITILRTSLLYGIGEALKKSNIFVWAMDQLRKGEDLNIVDDQMRTPTFVDDLARACLKVVQLNLEGVYNIAGGDVLSMYQFILILADYLQVNKNKVHPISTNKLNQKAPRPKSSGLDITKAQQEMSFQPTHFLESLKAIDLVD